MHFYKGNVDPKEHNKTNETNSRKSNKHWLHFIEFTDFINHFHTANQPRQSKLYHCRSESQ